MAVRACVCFTTTFQFTSTHFSSTFETVNNSTVPATHVLVFHYTSLVSVLFSCTQ